MALKNHSLQAPKPAEKVDLLAGLDDKALISLRQRIDMTLKVDLSRLNLAEELGLQYRAGMAMLQDLETDEGTPMNQRAQVYNSVRASLTEIIKQQKIVYTAERMKRYESAFLKVLQQLPPESTRVFFDLYGEFLQEGSEEAKARE